MSTFSTPSWGEIIGNYIGALLYGAAMISIGVFISSLTVSQIIAAIGTFIISVLLMYMDSWPLLSPTRYSARPSSGSLLTTATAPLPRVCSAFPA